MEPFISQATFLPAVLATPLRTLHISAVAFWGGFHVSDVLDSLPLPGPFSASWRIQFV